MTIAEHALKRLALLTGDAHARREQIFMHRFILTGIYNIAWDRGLKLDDISIFAERCNNFNCKMLGMETHFDSPYPLYCFVHEDYSAEYHWQWFLDAYEELKRNSIVSCIVPSIDVSEDILNLYLT